MGGVATETITRARFCHRLNVSPWTCKMLSASVAIFGERPNGRHLRVQYQHNATYQGLAWKCCADLLSHPVIGKDHTLSNGLMNLHRLWNGTDLGDFHAQCCHKSACMQVSCICTLFRYILFTLLSSLPNQCRAFLSIVFVTEINREGGALPDFSQSLAVQLMGIISESLAQP